VLIAFGAEEPRGTTDADHHYGSRTYVASLGPAERRAVRGMLSLDRVGVGTVVPVSSAVPSGNPQRQIVLAAGRRAGVPTTAQVN
jgi:aminopeptidase YwaD